MKYKSFRLFYLLSFLLLGLIPLLAILFNDGSMDFDAIADKASKATGLAWTSNLLVVLRLIAYEPLLLLLLFGSLVPAIAAILTLAFSKRDRKWPKFFGRLHPVRDGKWFRSLGVYGEIFVLMLLGLLVTLGLRRLTGGDYTWSEGLIGWQLIPSILVIAFLDQGAILEELGWRGFATPELQEKGMNPLRVALLIGICWGLWHVPRDVTTGVIDRLGWSSYLILYLPSFLLGTITVSIIASYYMNKLGGSVVPAIVVHGITNDAIGLSGAASIVEALTPYHQITRAIPFALIAFILWRKSGSGLNWENT